jgi:hypothetical protein
MNDTRATSTALPARRTFLLTAGAGLIALAWATIRRPVFANTPAAPASGPVTIVPFTDAGDRRGKHHQDARHELHDGSHGGRLQAL